MNGLGCNIKSYFCTKVKSSVTQPFLPIRSILIQEPKPNSILNEVAFAIYLLS